MGEYFDKDYQQTKGSVLEHQREIATDLVCRMGDRFIGLVSATEHEDGSSYLVFVNRHGQKCEVSVRVLP